MTSLFTMESTFFTNEVKGTKNLFIPVLHYKQKRLNAIKKILKKTIQTYKLDEFSIFTYEKQHYCICLTPVQKERLTKILKFSGSNNLNNFLKYGRNYAPLTIKHKDTVYEEAYNTKVSRGHQTLLYHWLTIHMPYKYKRVGKNTVTFVKTKIKE